MFGNSCGSLWQQEDLEPYEVTLYFTLICSWYSERCNSVNKNIRVPFLSVNTYIFKCVKVKGWAWKRYICSKILPILNSLWLLGFSPLFLLCNNEFVSHCHFQNGVSPSPWQSSQKHRTRNPIESWHLFETLLWQVMNFALWSICPRSTGF